jgi:hypothetical protein
MGTRTASAAVPGACMAHPYPNGRARRPHGGSGAAAGPLVAPSRVGDRCIRPAPVFVRPEVAVEVSFLGWDPARLRHPAYAGPTRLL